MNEFLNELMDENEVDEFLPPEEEFVGQDTEALMYRGYLTDVVEVGNHEIRIRTLKIGEELDAALVAQRYNDTPEAMRALATAIVSAAIVTVDGRPLVEALGPADATIQSKFDYIRKNWYWRSVGEVYKAYDQLLERSIKSLEELKKD